MAEKHVTLAYDLASQLTQLDRFGENGLVASTSFDFDKTGRLTDISHDRNSTTIASYQLEYDAANRLTDFTSLGVIDDFTVDYTYDDRNQLQTATFSNPSLTAFNEDYNYDANGNRLLGGGASQSAVQTDNRIQSDGTYTFEYDDEGNRTKRTDASGKVTEYEWDHRNRLTKVTDKNSSGGVTQTVAYEYDVFDRRLVKRLSADSDSYFEHTTHWVFDGDQAILEFTKSNQASLVTNRYLYGPGVDMILADEQVLNATSSGEVFWPLTDHLGSVRDLVDEAGTVREHIVYNSFGERVVEQDFDASGDAISSTDPAAVDHLFGYTGRDWDEDTQLQNNRARWYDPEQGRWISNDPSGFSAGDANLYRYVENETTTYTDPNGLEKWTSLGGWNPWSWPLPPRWAISWATGVGAADDEAIELERKRRTMQRLRYINDPSSIGSASGFMNTYRPSAEECDRLSTTAEIGVDANASLLGGSALKASLVGPSTVMRGSTSASSATRVVRGVERVDPRAVRFTQATASPNLSSGSATITALIKELEKNPELVEKLAIEVVEYNGKLYSLNNRRLAAFHQAGLTDVPIVRCSLQDSEIRRRFLQQVKDGLIDDGSKIIIVQGKSGQAQARKLADEAGRLGHLK